MSLRYELKNIIFFLILTTLGWQQTSGFPVRLPGLRGQCYLENEQMTFGCNTILVLPEFHIHLSGKAYWKTGRVRSTLNRLVSPLFNSIF